MFLAILNFIGTPLGKIAGIVGAVLFAATVLFGMLKIHDHNVRSAALAEWNKKQMEQVIEDQKRLDAGVNKLREATEQMREQAKKIQQSIDDQSGRIDEYLDSDEAKKADRPSSDVLKRTMKELSR